MVLEIFGMHFLEDFEFGLELIGVFYLHMEGGYLDDIPYLGTRGSECCFQAFEHAANFRFVITFAEGGNARDNHGIANANSR